MQRLPQLLICDDDSTFHLAVKASLKGKYECRSAYHSDEALIIVEKNHIDILLLDIQMRTPDEGLLAIPKFLEKDGDLAIVMSSGRSDFEAVRESMRLGAVDYVQKDFEPDDLVHVLSRVIERRALVQRKEQQGFEVAVTQRQHSMVGESPQVLTLRKTIERVRASSANVVIFGETGTGKEVVARQLRKTLPDGSLAPFIAVDSSTIQSSTAESILFGHEKGAFTGADRATKGIFEEAHGGIVYFDEIANMPLEIQAKLLRVIQEREVVRLGSSRVINSEFRVICATNRDLEEMAAEGTFKDDLMQRLNVLPLIIPPLRDRVADIPLLAAHFLRKQPGAADYRFSSEAMEVLKGYPWPGNVRELGNLIAYVVAMTDGPEVDVADLPPKFRDRSRADAGAAADAALPEGTGFYERVGAFEKQILAAEYQKYERNVSKMALGLGMDRSHLYTKLKEHGIYVPTKKEA